jgi:protein-disulfide isomerase
VKRALVLCALAACTSNKRLDHLEHEVHTLQGAQEDTHKDLLAVGQRLDAILRELRGRDNDADLEEKLDDLSKQLDVLTAKVASVPAAAPKRRPEPDPNDVYAVPIAGAAVDGPADALVTIVRAYDYACPYCEKSRATMDDIRARYPKEVRIVYRSFIVHPAVATLPAEAACAAQQEGHFVDYDKRLWDESFAQRKFDQTEMETIAGEVGLDLDRFRADMSGACVSRIGVDQQEMAAVGVGATPTFFINGRYLSGAQPLPSFTAVIDEELALAKKRVKAGTKKTKYYETWILKKGKAKFTAPAASTP